ncbi:MAG: hypothetical protein DI547_12480 [Sphingobium sp.]|jgi:hypothetical protein|nr:MAG: hypothetical protein DI547_12480 [Sphingobium sp.]
MTKTFALLAALAAIGTPAFAQYGNGGPGRDGGSGVSAHDAVDAAILSDISRSRAADKDAKQAPYATPGYGPIATAKAAREACASDALQEAGGSAKIIGVPRAATMSTGWEVEGRLDAGNDGPTGFVCSVRNGSVSGILLK